MSSKTTTETKTAIQYNEPSMSNYNQFQGTIGNYLNQMASNPLSSSFFSNQLAQAQGQAQQVGQRTMANNLFNLRTGGGLLGKSGAYMTGLVNSTQRSNNVLQSNAFNSALGSALNNRNFALASMQAYNPLQTGQDSSQTTTKSSGIGGVLGSIASAGLNFAMPGLGSMLGGGTFGGGYAPQPSYIPARPTFLTSGPYRSV